MKRFELEVTVGVFVLIGLISLAYLSIRLGRMEVFGARGYDLYAKLSNTGGLKEGSAVEIAGVEVGRVREITLEQYQAKLVISLQPEVKIQEDAILSIKTKGLMGEKYVSISPGGSERFLAPGEQMREAQPPVDLEEIMAKYVFGKI